MTDLDLVLGSGLAIAVVAAIVGFYLARKFYQRTQVRQSKAFEMGGRQVRGDMYQLLGEFAVLNDYEQIMTLSSTSRQGSLDLIGVKADSVDFIEFKKKGAALHGPERKIKVLIDQKKVNYVVKDVDLPDGFSMKDRGGDFDPNKFKVIPFNLDETKADESK
jgi:hypothetical protein